ncbi:UNVERIFIED_CONTAM: hypothetical protein NCL1_39325 [Trichonephila clavipes]
MYDKPMLSLKVISSKYIWGKLLEGALFSITLDSTITISFPPFYLNPPSGHDHMVGYLEDKMQVHHLNILPFV